MTITLKTYQLVEAYTKLPNVSGDTVAIYKIKIPDTDNTLEFQKYPENTYWTLNTEVIING